MLTILLFLISFDKVLCKYDAKSTIENRVKHLKQVCDRYRNEHTYEHSALFDEIKDPSANYVQNIASKFFICVPPENGAIYWNRYFRQIHNYDLKVGKEYINLLYSFPILFKYFYQ